MRKTSVFCSTFKNPSILFFFHFVRRSYLYQFLHIFRLIASASFDKSVRLWRASDGAFICTFRGHVQAVYSVAWAADSRLFVTGSKDSTLKGKARFEIRQKRASLENNVHKNAFIIIVSSIFSLECQRQEIETRAARPCRWSVRIRLGSRWQPCCIWRQR